MRRICRRICTDLQLVIHKSICWALCKRNVPVEILPYWSVKYELSFSNGIVYRNDRILVTAALQKTLLINN